MIRKIFSFGLPIFASFYLLSCVQNSSFESQEYDIEDSLVDNPFYGDEKDSPFIKYDLYRNKRYEKEHTLFQNNTKLKFSFNGNIDFYGSRTLSLHFEAKSKTDTVITDLNLGSLNEYEFVEITNFDTWFKCEYEGLVGEVLIKNSGDYKIELNLILGEDIVAVNKAEISIYAYQ